MVVAILRQDGLALEEPMIQLTDVLKFVAIQLESAL